MSFIGWLIVVALAYIAIGKILFIVVNSFQRKSFVAVLFNIAGIAASLVVANVITMLWRAFAAISDYYQAPAVLLCLSQIGITVILLSCVQGITRERLTWQDKKRRRELSRQINLHLALATGALVFSVPFYWLITTSLKPDERTNMFPPDLIPVQQREVKVGGVERKVYLTDFDGVEVKVAKLAELENDEWEVLFLDDSEATRIIPRSHLRPELHPVALWSNYTEALRFLPPEYNKGLRPLWNTVYVTALAIFGTIISSSLVAFAFARLRWPGRDLLFVVMLATMMVPAAVTMLPVFLIFRSLNWIDTLRPLWVTAFFGSGFNVFLLRQFFLTIPNDLEDAAKIDGCSYFTIYWRIMLPLIKPALAALTIFAFMGNWNNFMGPLIYISSPEKMTLAYALQLFQGAHGGEPAMMMAAATLVMLPVLAVFFFTQRYMIQGVTLTGIKG